MAEAILVFEGELQKLTEKLADLYLVDQQVTVGYHQGLGEWMIFTEESVGSMNSISVEIPDDYAKRIEEFMRLRQTIIEDARVAIQVALRGG